MACSTCLALTRGVGLWSTITSLGTWTRIGVHREPPFPPWGRVQNMMVVWKETGCDFQRTLNSMDRRLSMTSRSTGNPRSQRVNCPSISPAAILAVYTVLLAVQEPAWASASPNSVVA